MPRVIVSSNGRKQAVVRKGIHGGGPGTVPNIVRDGDTINVSPLESGFFPVRMLGIDTPEKSLPLNNSSQFTPLDRPEWVNYLDAPFSTGLNFTAALTQHISAAVAGGGAAVNHRTHAEAAEDELEREVQADQDEYVASGRISGPEEFQFFMRFANEVLDGFGRFLAFINRNQPDPDTPSPRPEDYNTRLLASGFASPYFIWPNIDPFRSSSSLLDAVFAPGTAPDVASGSTKLRVAREAVAQARQSQIGIYASGNKLSLEAFEVRFLARRQPPRRWVIDLSANDDILVHPQNYHSIPNSEDRLFLNTQHVPLFLQAGWVRQQAPI